MKQGKLVKLILSVSLILLIGILSGCGLTTPDTTPPDETSGTQELSLRVTFKEINLAEGNFSLKICSLNQVGFNALGFTYSYYDSENNEITELSNSVDIPFEVIPSGTTGTAGSTTEVDNIPLYFNEVANYFIEHTDIQEISCTVNLVGTDSLQNDHTILIVSGIPIIERGVEPLAVTAVIKTTPDPPTGEVPLTVHFDATESEAEEGEIVRYCWHFHDDSDCYACQCPSELACPMHTYENCGSYIATLCVWDKYDNMDCAAVVVNVTAIQMNITVTANPATIAPKESSTISAYLTDQCDNPIPDGTRVVFYTTNGDLSNTFADTVDGIATVDLTLNEPVIATVTAVCDDASGSIIVRAVELGITVTANPATISPGDFSTISAYLVDSFGEPVPDGTTITFSTSEGILSSNFATTTVGLATVELQLSRVLTAIVTANYGTVSGSTMVICTDGPIAIIENDTDDQISPIEITANSDCPYTITFNAYNSIPGTSPPLKYEWSMTHPDGTVEDLGNYVVTDPYVFDECGIYVITLTVCDSCDNPSPHFDTATMRIIVTNPEGPTAIITSSEPIVGSTISITANSDCAYPVTFFGDKSTTTAICGDIEEYSWTIVEPDGGTVDAGSNMMMIYPFDTCGTYVVRLTVTDGCDRIADTFVTVIVSEPEGPTAVITSSEPIVGTTITITANSDCPYSITFYGHESSTSLECEDIIAYDWQIIDPEGAEVPAGEIDTDNDVPDGIKMVYDSFDICGVYAVKLTVTDGCGNTDSEALTVIVQEPTGPTAVITSSEPIVGTTITITANSDCPYSITFYGHESSTSLECEDIIAYDWQIIDPEGAEVPAGEIDTDNDVPDGIKMVYDSFDICGVYAVKLTVTDGCGNTDSEALTVIVQEPTGPTAVITGSPGNIEACSGCPYPAVFNGSSSTPGASCGGLTYAWTIDVPPGVTPTVFSPDNGQTASYNFEECGTYTVTLVVTDGCDNTDSTSVTLEVTEPGPPTAVITNTTGQTSPIEIEACMGCPFEVGFDGTSSTTNALCGGLTYAWTIVGPGAPLSFSPDNAETANYEFIDCGTYKVTLMVTDDCGNTDSAMVSVIVTEPANPVADIANTESSASPIQIKACSGCPYTIGFDGTGSTNNTACGDLTYAWTIIDPTASSTSGSASTISYNFTELGTHTVTLLVTDVCGNTDTEMVVVVVSDCCLAAAFSYTPTSPVFLGQVVQFDGSASSSDCGCGILTWSWNWGDGTPDGSGETTSHAYTTAGTYTVTLTVTDVCGNTANATMDITVLLSGARAEWTVMVYVGGDNSLDPDAWNDLGEMEAVGSTGQVKIVVQLDADKGTSCDGTYRYYVTGGVAPGASCPYYPADIVGVLPEQDMADPSVMADFVNWATTNYPADHYLLILWDHGGGWKEASIIRGVMPDDNSSSIMSMQELASGLSSCNEHIDIIGFDACLMGMIEVAYEIESSVMDAPDYMVASERSEWNDGWPYDDFLNHLTSNPLMSAATLGETIVEDYIDFGYASATLSVVDLDNFSSIADPIFDAFRAALILSGHQAAIATARVNAQLYPYTANDIFKDIYDFAYRIYNNVSDCTTEALDVMNFVDNVVVYEEWVGSDMQDSHGLSIFLTDSKTVGYDANYDSLEFNVDTDWKSFLLSP